MSWSCCAVLRSRGFAARGSGEADNVPEVDEAVPQVSPVIRKDGCSFGTHLPVLLCNRCAHVNSISCVIEECDG